MSFHRNFHGKFSPRNSIPPLMSMQTTVEKVFIHLDHADREFHLRSKVVGVGGDNLHHIRTESGARVTLHGKGSGFIEGATGAECSEPMHLRIEHPQFEVVQRGKQLSLKLVATLRQEFVQWQRQQTARQMSSVQQQGQNLRGSFERIGGERQRSNDGYRKTTSRPFHHQPNHSQSNHRQQNHHQSNHRQQNHHQPYHRQSNPHQPNHQQSNHRQQNHRQQNHRQQNHQQSNHRQQNPQQSNHRQQNHYQPSHHQQYLQQSNHRQQNHQEQNQHQHNYDGERTQTPRSYYANDTPKKDDPCYKHDVKMAGYEHGSSDQKPPSVCVTSSRPETLVLLNKTPPSSTARSTTSHQAEGRNTTVKTESPEVKSQDQPHGEKLGGVENKPDKQEGNVKVESSTQEVPKKRKKTKAEVMKEKKRKKMEAAAKMEGKGLKEEPK